MQSVFVFGQVHTEGKTMLATVSTEFCENVLRCKICLSILSRGGILILFPLRLINFFLAIKPKWEYATLVLNGVNRQTLIYYFRLLIKHKNYPFA